MSHASTNWQSTDFFKGFLTPRWRHRQKRYVVLAQFSPKFGIFHDQFGSDSNICKDENDESMAELSLSVPFSSPVINPRRGTIEFYLFNREDVEPPSDKYISEPTKVDRCFFMCPNEKEKCDCKLLHVKKDAWRLRLDTIDELSEFVCFNEERIEKVKSADVHPTAGYFYALGLRHEGFPCVFPRICHSGRACSKREACMCIHLDPRTSEPLNANMPLCSIAKNLSSDACALLTQKRLECVGDIQVLSDYAFTALMGEAPQEILEEILAVSTCRFFEPQSALLNVLNTFPHMPSNLESYVESFQTVGDILKLTPFELYAMQMEMEVVRAFEIIRKRLEADDPFVSMYLEDYNPNAFIPRALSLILKTAEKYAHFSWRRHDPHRPVVSSMITFVDVGKCNCPSGKTMEAGDAGQEWAYSDDFTRKEMLPAPHGSWCDCPRMWEVAVNYELSTPMGSRCSEQNVMAAIARSGAPTWSIREVVVHGNKGKTEMNPLFPCGVCENMLRKVDADVRKRYGMCTMLFMFDQTVPTKVFSLPLREISLRDNPRFQRLLETENKRHT